MNALVTGGAGFIGSSLSRRLLDEGWTVVVVDDLSNSKREAVPEGVRFVQADVAEADALAAVMDGIDVVFHQAAVRSVPRSIEEPRLVHNANATGTLNVLIAAADAGVRRVVYASSSSVYGGAGEGACRESDRVAPLSPYAVSKLSGEFYCRVWASLGSIETVSLRYFNVFGPGQQADSQYAAVFPAFISALREGRSPEIQWDGEQSRDFTFIDDVVRANVLAASADAASGHVFNVAGGQPRTINQVYDAVSQVLGTDIEPTRTPRRAGDIRHSLADTSKAAEMLGWRVEVQWDEAVSRTVQWFAQDQTD